MNIIAIDLASEVSCVCVCDQRGQILREEAVETSAKALKKLVRVVKEPRTVVFEEGPQAAWLLTLFEPVCSDVFVCDPRKNRQLAGMRKSDKFDARALAERARLGALSRVWHGQGELRNMREAVRHYQAMTKHSTRLKNQMKAIFRSNGIRAGARIYDPKRREEIVKRLPLKEQQTRVFALGDVLSEVGRHRTEALKQMVRLARSNRMYPVLRAIDGIGPIFASKFIAEVGYPQRFRTKQQLWSYAGLAVSTYESSEFELVQGRTIRKRGVARTRGLVRSYNRTLKYLFKQTAMTLSRTKWRPYYEQVRSRTSDPNKALLTVARKLAAVMLRVAKTGERYDITKILAA